MSVKTAMIIKKFLYSALPTDTLANRIKKAKLIGGVTQKDVVKLTGLSRATINELERGYREDIGRDTLLKLISVLDKDILCDDYFLYILNQRENLSNLIYTLGISKLSKLLNSHNSTIYRWRDEINTLPRSKYNIIKNMNNT